MEHRFTMDLNATGTSFNKITNVGAVSGGEGYLLETDNAVILFDSGYGCGGDALVRNIEKCLHGRSLDYILLSHSHYDHAPGSAWCKHRWPDAKIIATHKTKSVFSKPGARAVMRELDAIAAKMYGAEPENDYFDDLTVDIALDDNETISLNGLKMQLISLPGHTWCSCGYWFEESKTLLGSETLGVYAGGDPITPAFLIGFSVGVESIYRALSMDIKHMLIPHVGMVHNDVCKEYLEYSLISSRILWDGVYEGYKNGLSKDELVNIIISIFYTDEKRFTQPVEAFTLNAGYIVDSLIKEFNA